VYQVTERVLDLNTLMRSLLKAGDVGSVVIHCAVVRGISGQTITSSAAYAALPGAEAELEQIGSELKVKWRIEDIALVRRTGCLAPGEIISMVGAAATHREEAFSACEEAVARLKEMKCIKKEEVLQDQP